MGACTAVASTAAAAAAHTHATGGAPQASLGLSVHQASGLLSSCRCSAHPTALACAAGQFRGGRPLWAWQPLPSLLAVPAFGALALAQLRPRVAIWTVTVSAFLPEELLPTLDGLVLAAPGTGSLPLSLIEQLSGPRGDAGSGGRGQPWTHRLPIVISSRCVTGANHDDFLYRGSRDKYERHGFLLAGYELLTPLQARTLLLLRLAAHGRG